MTTRDRTPTGQFCWTDLSSSDVAAARAFYGAVLGWEAGEANEEFGGYFQFFSSGAPVAGAMPKMDPGMPDGWMAYVAVEDAGDFTTRAEAAGATVVAPAMQVGDMGSMAVAVDPAGAAIGVWAPISFQGFGRVAEPGAPAWFELYSRDYATSVDFYKKVFGWDTRVEGDTDDFRYTVATADEDMFAGMMDASGFLPEGVPSNWGVYFAVADVDAAVATAESMGATVFMPPTDTPYGRLAQLADPSGAGFRLINAR
ncbi:MAG TPA: VOC family protein [Acidimicrobiales bacterium]|nr:VOC family protein [Acidimicrobiales bacterium]